MNLNRSSHSFGDACKPTTIGVSSRSRIPRCYVDDAEVMELISSFFEIISGAFIGTISAYSLLIIPSYLFLAGFAHKNSSSWFSVSIRKVSGPVKEDVSSHVTELGSQAKLGPDMSLPAHARRLQQEADFSPQSSLKTDIKSKNIQPIKLPERQTEAPESKLITLKEAVEAHGVAYETLRSWYRGGYLPEKGREVFHTHGGGKILVDEKDVLRLKSQPPARGKPPINPKE
jgi:hypothetical protein